MDERTTEPLTTSRFVRLNVVRLLFGAVLFTAVYGAMVVWMPYRRELQIARKIESVGGTVHLGYYGPTWIPRPIQNTPLFFDRIDFISLEGQHVSGDLISDLRTLTNLRILNLSNTQVTDAGLVHLNGLTNLKNLLLENSQVTDASLEHLNGLTSLELLDLQGTKTTRTGRAMLRKPSCTILPFDLPDPPRIMDPEWYHRHQTPVDMTECLR